MTYQDRLEFLNKIIETEISPYNSDLYLKKITLLLQFIAKELLEANYNIEEIEGKMP